MDKESIYQRQLIDCNCNDCIFMTRDMIKFKAKKTPSRIHYGSCEKLNKDVTFIPNYCQVDTQECFKHRKK